MEKPQETKLLECTDCSYGQNNSLLRTIGHSFRYDQSSRHCYEQTNSDGESHYRTHPESLFAFGLD